MKTAIKIKGMDIPVLFEKEPKEDMELIVYSFDHKGKFVESSIVDKKKAHFKLDKFPAEELRFFIAPLKPDKKKSVIPTIKELENMMAYEPVIEKDERGKYDMLPIPEFLHKFWCWKSLRVRGQVVKSFFNDGLWQDKPISRARVHICEVDPIWLLIPKIPDHIIARIKEIFIKPVFDEPIIATELQPFEIPPRPEPDPMFFKMMPTKLPVLRQEIKEQLFTPDLNMVRTVIADNYKVFHPYLCRIKWAWPYFYNVTEKKVVYTDTNGRFDTSLFYQKYGDKPDIYFRVDYFIDDMWTTVYKPWVAYNTYWNYRSGRDVTIRLTDKRVEYECNDIIKGAIACVKTIGYNTSVSHIKQTLSPVFIQGKTFNRLGLCDLLEPGNFRNPFGGSLLFTVQFGDAFPSIAVKFYRWSYRLVNVLNQTPLSGWQVIKTPVSKRYRITTSNGSGPHFVYNYYPLGPVGTKDLFTIPPVSPKGEVSTFDPTAEWDQNTYSARLNSENLANGVYEFKMELFDKNEKLISVPMNTFQRLKMDGNSSINAGPEYLIPDSATKASAFKMFMRIDNSKCLAEVYKVKVDGTELATPCGFVSYQKKSSDVELSFKAAHPNDFATFRFEVVKGSVGHRPQAETWDAMVIGDTPSPAVYKLGIDDKYKGKVTAGYLLDGCVKAAFAENVFVYALGVNGTNRLYHLDARAAGAFALEPNKKPEDLLS